MFTRQVISTCLALAVYIPSQLTAASPCDLEDKECPVNALNLLQSKFEHLTAEKKEEADAQESTDAMQLVWKQGRGAATLSTMGSFTLPAGVGEDKLIEREEVVQATSEKNERGWFACKVKKTPPPSEDDALDSIDVVETVSCTHPAPIKKLCCSRWTSAEFIESGMMDFRLDQNTSASDAQVGNEVLKICTIKKIPAPHLSAISEPVECISEDFSMKELHGEGKNGESLHVGELLLRQRLLWFQEAGTSMATVPKCADLSVTCDDGEPPVTVKEDWLAEHSRSE